MNLRSVFCMSCGQTLSSRPCSTFGSSHLLFCCLLVLQLQCVVVQLSLALGLLLLTAGCRCSITDAMTSSPQ